MLDKHSNGACVHMRVGNGRNNHFSDCRWYLAQDPKTIKERPLNPIIIVQLDRVIIDGEVFLRPILISRSEWMQYWYSTKEKLAD